jgi:hypothetical protein
MLVSIPLGLDSLPGKPQAADFEAAYRRHYDGAPYVRVEAAPKSGRIDALALNGTDDMELFVFANEARRQAVLVARVEASSEAGLERLKADLAHQITASGLAVPDFSGANPGH